MAVQARPRPDAAYYRRVQWVATLLPAISLGGFEFIRHGLFDRVLPRDLGNLAAAAVVAVWGWLYVHSLIGMIERVNADLYREREAAAVLRERDRIARRMHDGVSQALFYMNVAITDLRRASADVGQAGVANSLSDLQAAVTSTYSQVRSTIADLRSHAVAQDLRQPVEAEARRAAEQAGWRLELALADAPIELPTAAQEHVLGILGEALTNVRKHAQAHSVSVQLGRTGHRLELQVADDGVGLGAPDESLHFGLAMMRERTNALGGTLSLTSQPGGGTRVRLRWPEQTGGDGVG